MHLRLRSNVKEVFIVIAVLTKSYSSQENTKYGKQKHFFPLCNQLSLANKATNGSTSEQALVAPAPPTYEEATAGMTGLYLSIFSDKVSQ